MLNINQTGNGNPPPKNQRTVPDPKAVPPTDTETVPVEPK